MSRKRVPGIIYLRESLNERSRKFIAKSSVKNEKLNYDKEDIITKEEINSHKLDNIFIENNKDITILTPIKMHKKYSFERKSLVSDDRKLSKNIGLLALSGLILLKLKLK